MTELNEALAKAVAWWVEREALTQSVIASRGGPSTTSLTKILSGRGSVRPGSITDLDIGLRWGSGTAAAYLAGEDPLGIDRASDAPLNEWSDDQLVRELARRLASRRAEDETDAIADAGEKIDGLATPAKLSEPRSNVVHLPPRRTVTEDDLRGMKGVADRSPDESPVEDAPEPDDGPHLDD